MGFAVCYKESKHDVDPIKDPSANPTKPPAVYMAPAPPGCCTLHDSQHPSTGWAARCAEFWNEDECTSPMDGFMQPRCDWTETDQYFDCSTMTNDGDVDASAPMAGAASADANAGDHGSDGFESMAIGAAVGAMVMVLIAVFV